METLFENSYIRSPEIAKNFYRYICFKRPFILTFDIFIGLSFIINTIYLIFGYTATYSVLVLAPVFYLFQIIQYLRAVKTMIKCDNELANGTATTVNTIVTSESMKCTSSSGSVNEIPLSKFKKVIKTKRLILVRSEAKLIYIFPKDSFTKGSSDEFIAFLNAKITR